MDRDLLLSKFKETYGSDGEEIRVFFAPVPLNLVGEHTNYNGGHVLSCAADFGVWLAVRERTDRHVRIRGVHDVVCEIRDIDLELPEEQVDERDWARYFVNTIRVYEKLGAVVPNGVDILVGADIADLNRYFFSHACYVAAGLALRETLDIPFISNMDIAERAQQAEDLTEGESCGVLNALSAIIGIKGYATLLNTKTFAHEFIPMKLGDYARIVITNGMIDQPVVEPSSKVIEFNDTFKDLKLRRTQCARALKKLQSVRNINYLCDIAWDEFESCKDVIMNDEIVHRARHVVYENARAIRAANALRVGNLHRLGEMMFKSHESLRDEYGVSCPELDFLVERSKSIPEVLGSRIYGPGIGGCMLSIVEVSGIEKFKEVIGGAYYNEYGLHPDFYIADTDFGAREVKA